MSQYLLTVLLAEELSEQNPWSGQRVFMQIQDVRLFTVNRDHFMGQALAICGVDNIFADAPLSVAPVSLEAVIGARPNFIVTVTQANQKDPWTKMWRTHLPAARLVEFRTSDVLKRLPVPLQCFAAVLPWAADDDDIAEVYVYTDGTSMPIWAGSSAYRRML